ncbi:Jag N-terminal domain-containing protein [Campylobacter sp. 19-13652]|uniref:Jag N-terminal domain-containing protein n=1 Tax=Campylobacter sp. 19-13652 TaxID=2840180 RepID=UPI001C777CF0|nr:Jag N-terminal domain-containing protein [Campylobacter sp. 19-13652]BCX79166.1 hypothetical protein LBC_06280 [Campylobacter sp. 19-13652]
MRIEAPSLQEAFARAADELKCSVTELDIKVLQHPRAGFFGLFKKPAIIEVARENGIKFDDEKHHENRKKEHVKESVWETNKGSNDFISKKNRQKRKEQKQALNNTKDNQGFDNFFKEEFIGEAQNTESKEQKHIKKEQKPTKSKHQDIPKQRHKERGILDNSIIDTFNQARPAEETKSPASSETLNEIKQKLIKLFEVSDFDINSIDVFAYDDETIQICLDGADAALLIGKEGHRYKALSYILFNWINLKYNYALRLEIAQFLKAQEESARQYAVVLAQKVDENGRVQSRPIDGVGLKIILDELRATFPNKYVGVKNTQEGKCVVVNEFYRK